MGETMGTTGLQQIYRESNTGPHLVPFRSVWLGACARGEWAR